MTRTPAPPQAAALEPAELAVDDDELRTAVARMARTILLHALLVGIAADLLLRDGFTGLGFPVWLVILASSALSLVWRDGRSLPREAGLWLGVAVLFGAAMAWRDAGGLQFLDFVATLFALGMTAVSLGDPRAALLAERLRDTVWAGLRIIRSVAVGALPLALRDIALPVARREPNVRFRPAMRAALIALPLLLVFGALLRGADPVFASLVTLPAIDVGALASHVVIIGFFAWVTAGWARGALLAGPPGARLPERLPFSLAALDVTAALGTLNALFALYVLTQLGWFFGGERFLQAQTGLTAAEYARQGFFQMVWVVLLVVPVLLATRAALRPGRELERRHTALALPLIGLLGVMIVSAMLRMRLYVRYYGLTLDRFYPLVFMGWLVIVLVWLALTVLRGRGRPFVAGAVVSGLAILVALNLIVPDAIVARVNVARGREAAAGAEPLDLEYLTTLGGDAVPAAVAAVRSAPSRAGGPEALAGERARCNASTRLLSRWAPSAARLARREESAAEWRSWNRGEAVAAQAVRANTGALRAIQHDACARVRSVSPTPAARMPTAPAGR
jgi:hypothetical protein